MLLGKGLIATETQFYGVFCFVFFLEESGCDFSCVVSSLVELMADPHYRSISGFENLVQKEWVAYGHHFTTRHGLVPLSTEEDHQVVSSSFPP